MEKKTWIEFKNTGLLWWINMILHTFGWAIVLEIDKDTKELLDVYPARVKFRGFSEQCNTDGYQNVSRYLTENAKELEEECYWSQAFIERIRAVKNYQANIAKSKIGGIS